MRLLSRLIRPVAITAAIATAVFVVARLGGDGGGQEGTAALEAGASGSAPPGTDEPMAVQGGAPDVPAPTSETPVASGSDAGSDDGPSAPTGESRQGLAIEPALPPLTLPISVPPSAGLVAAAESALLGSGAVGGGLAAPHAGGAGALPVTADTPDFVRPFVMTPDAFCALLALHGMPTNGWRPDPVSPGRWSCASAVVPLATAGGVATETLFAFASGTEFRLEFVRFKRSLADGVGGGALAGGPRIAAIIAAFYTAQGWTLSPAVVPALAMLTAVSDSHLGITVSVAPELADSRQVNVVIAALAATQAAAPTGFLPRP